MISANVLWRFLRPINSAHHLIFPILPLLFLSSLSVDVLYVILISFLSLMFVFAINQMFDVDTDSKNYQKKSNPFVSAELKKRDGFLILLVLLVMSIALSFSIFGAIPTYCLILVFVAGAIYSCPPFRFKGRFILDMLTHGVLSVFLLMFSFYALSINANLTFLAILGFLISVLFNFYNQIGDIVSDREARLRTTSVVLGERKPHLIYLLLFIIVYAASLFLFLNRISPYILVFGIVLSIGGLGYLILEFRKRGDILSLVPYNTLWVFYTIIILTNLM